MDVASGGVNPNAGQSASGKVLSPLGATSRRAFLSGGASQPPPDRSFLRSPTHPWLPPFRRATLVTEMGA